MSYRELTIIEIKEVLRRWQAEQSLRQITGETGLDRKAVRRYTKAATSSAFTRETVLDDAAVDRVARRVQGRGEVERTAEWREIEQQRSQIEAWLSGTRPLRLREVHILLKRQGVKASYRTLRRYAQQKLGWRKKRATVRLEDPPPGQEAQVDFGRMGLVRDDERRAVSGHVPHKEECRAVVPRDGWRSHPRHDQEVPREVFQTEEKVAMLPPPTEPFDLPFWVEANAHADHHVQVARALYSVPTQVVGKTMRVRADRTTVRIPLGAELVKVHPRKAPGQRSTDVNDYPPGKAAYALRSVDALVAKAKGKGVHVGTYAERIVAGPLPWSRMRQGYALLRLCDKYGPERLDSCRGRDWAPKFFGEHINNQVMLRSFNRDLALLGRQPGASTMLARTFISPLHHGRAGPGPSLSGVAKLKVQRPVSRPTGSALC
jgi:hypothetical protein